MKKIFALLFTFFVSNACSGAYYYGKCLYYECNSLERKLYTIDSTSDDDKFFYSYNISLEDLQQKIKEHGIATVIDLGDDEGPEQQEMVLYESKGAQEAIELKDLAKQVGQEEKQLLNPQQLDVKHYKIPLVSRGFNEQNTILQLFKIYEVADRPILVYSSSMRKAVLAAGLWAVGILKKPNHKILREILKEHCLLEDYFLIMSWEGKDWLEKDYNAQNIKKKFDVFNRRLSRIECGYICCEIFCCCVGLCDTRGRFCCTRIHHINKLERETFGVDEFGRK